MILKSIMNNPLDGKPKPWKPWYGYLFLAIMVVGAGLYVYERVHGGPVIPTMAVPAQVYENARAALEHQQQVIISSSSGQNSGLEAVARAAVSALNGLDVAEMPLPTSTDLAVPFITQSPSGTWTDAERDLSEETMFVMTMKYFVSGAEMDEAKLEQIRVAMIHERLSMATFASFVETYDPGYGAVVIEDPTIEEIKTYLADGTPVIVPTDGALLQNPFYIAAGLPYHCILLRGYNETQFIANDPGTRRGEAYVYEQSVVMDAMSDWDEDEALRGGKRILIITPN